MRAVTSFTVEVKGALYIVHTGDVLPSTHPVVKAHPELFEATAKKGKR